MDSSYEWIGFLVITLLSLGSVVMIGGRWQDLWPPLLLLAAVATRILGATVRYEILFEFYRGAGDSVQYFRDSLPIAESLRNFETSPLDKSFWLIEGKRWGTTFIISLSGLVLSLLGPSLRGEFVIFSLFAFGGLVALAVAFARVQYERRVVYAAWIWFFPSLWFWPSSVGKESILLLAIGLTTLGYVGTSDGMRWHLLAMGLGLAFLIRPHVAAVLAMSVVAAEWLQSWNRVSPRRVLEAFAVGALSIVLFLGMTAQFGVQRPELDSMTDLLQWQRIQTMQGGSSIGAVPLTLIGVPLAFVNIWMRPFLWEAHNLTALFASIEIVAFWALVAWRRREVATALRHWRQHRLLRFALPLLISYTLMIGMTFGNLGLIARQRTLIFPFMLMFLVAVPSRPSSPVASR